jgi:putative transposase
MKILWNGTEFQIEERLSNGQLRLLNKHTEERRFVKEMSLIEASFEGNLKILGFNNEHQNLEEKIQKNHVFDFTALDKEDPRKKSALRKYAYVKELISHKKAHFSDKEISKVIKKVSQQINDPYPPSSRTVRRWTVSFITSGEDIRALVSANMSKGNRNSKFSKDSNINLEIVKIINECIAEVYLTLQQNSVQTVLDLVEYRIYKINETRSEGNRLPIPDYSSIYRIISLLDEYEVDKARKGEKYANEKHKTLCKAPEPTRPMERVECDDTKTDLLILDPVTSLALGRPWLMILVDVFTRMILGYFLSFYPPSHVTVMMAMKHAIRPKTYVKDKYPDIVNTWDTYGLIDVLVIDNAKHWYGNGLEDAFYQMGTDMQFAPVRIPWYKGAVEKLLQTIHSGLIHKQPGTTFSNIFDKGDYDPEKHAVIWLDLLDEILHKWIIDVYSQDIHDGIKDIPARRWENSIVKYPPALPPAHTNLDIILGKIAYRKISGTVIHFKNLEYSDSVLATIRANQKKSDEVKIKYDPTDLGMIYVYDAFWCRYVPVPAVDQEYAKGLTEWQHEVICKFIRRTNQARIDRKSLAEAKEYIRQKIAKEFGRKPKKLKAAGKIAKWMAFEDPTKIKIIYHSNNGKDSQSDEKPAEKPIDNPSKLLNDGNKFIPPLEQSSTTLVWTEDEKWNSLYADFDEEES